MKLSMLNLLYVHWHVNPILFQIGSLEVRWYGLLVYAARTKKPAAVVPA